MFRGNWVTCWGSAEHFAYRAVTFYGPHFHTVPLYSAFVTSRPFCNTARQDPQHRIRNGYSLLHVYGLGCFLFARRYSGNRGCFLFLGVLRWFTSPGIAFHAYFIQHEMPRYCRGGFPHSEIPGSLPASGSPRLIAASPRPSSPADAKASTRSP